MKASLKGTFLDLDKPKRPTKHIPKSVKIQVWNKYIGLNKATGICYVCNEHQIHITDFEVGHNKARSKGGSDNIANLRPICRLCNRSMKTMSIEAYRKRYFGKTR